MQYIISFLEGIITFISPCLLPMLPIYISYFAGGGERSTKKTLINALGFVLGFTLLFTAMGALAGSVGVFLHRHQTVVNIIGGLVVIIFGLQTMGLLRFTLFKGVNRRMNTGNMGFSLPCCSASSFPWDGHPVWAHFSVRHCCWPRSRTTRHRAC